MTTELSAVIPVYNEVENLRRLHAELSGVLGRLGRDYEVVYVDDGSDDGSAELLAALQREDPRVVVVRFARNYGQTAALAAGFAEAHGGVVIALDADGQNDPSEIPALLAKLDEGFDVVVGWRWPRQDPFLSRRLPSQLANGLIGWATGVALHDYGCTLKAMRRDVVKDLRLYGELHRFIPALAADLGARVTEIKVHHRARWAGRSKYGLSRTVRVLLDLITVRFLTSYATRPIQVFGVVGLVSSAIGLVLTAILGLQRVLLGVPLANRPLVWLGILLTLMGLQFITMGLLGELLVRTYHESQNKPVYRVAEVRRSPAHRAVTA